LRDDELACTCSFTAIDENEHRFAEALRLDEGKQQEESMAAKKAAKKAAPKKAAKKAPAKKATKKR
jgi:hypothetical protein